MDDLALLVDLHRDAARQGPGGPEQTRLALGLAGLEPAPDLAIADIGCGTGASALILAQELGARVTAVDLMPEFLAALRARASAAGLADRIETVEASMDALPFGDQRFDALWSEGAVYNMGFAAGVSAWRRHLKPGGVLAVSELTWLTATRPEPLERHWTEAYPEVAAASAKLATLEAAGYAPIGYFTLPPTCWMDGYYTPMRERFEAFLDRHGRSEAARALIAAEEAEIALYERYCDYVSYGVYIARRVD